MTSVVSPTDRERRQSEQTVEAFKRLVFEEQAVVYPAYRSHPNAGVDAVFVVKASSGGLIIPDRHSGAQIHRPDSDKGTSESGAPRAGSDAHRTGVDHTDHSDLLQARLWDLIEALLTMLGETQFSSFKALLYGEEEPRVIGGAGPST